MIAAGVLRLEDLPVLLGARRVHGRLAGPWTRVEYDSRRAASGDVFVAVRGEKADGHAHVADAAARGAAAAVVERPVAGIALPQIEVSETRRALAVLACEEAGHPSRELVLAGVTGTNGKTTTTYLLRSVLQARGDRVGLIGTVAYEFGGEQRAAPHTTPEAPELQRQLRAWCDGGATAVVMEVSSHALALERTYGSAFDLGVFTNLTQDHLDFHGTLEAYRDAKARLFRADSRGDATKRFAGAFNVSDPAGRWIQVHADAPGIGFGEDAAGAEVWAEDVQLHPAGTRLRIREGHGSQPVALRLRGAFNVMNALAAYAGARGLGIQLATITAGLEAVARVPGRLDPVECGQPFQVLVDYAHTPDALGRALEAVRALKPRRVLCVFGCGGDRDRGKRPLMGAVAARLADQVFLTSDNPRSERPEAILAEIEAGTRGAAHVRTIADRREAIHAAMEACEPSDALLIAGKGHETDQIIGTETLPFDDRAVAAEALRRRGFAA